MYIVRAEYNPLKNSIDIVNGGNYILRLDCWEGEKRLRVSPGGQHDLNALAIDDPLQYAAMALEGSMQSWLDCGDGVS